MKKNQPKFFPDSPSPMTSMNYTGAGILGGVGAGDYIHYSNQSTEPPTSAWYNYETEPSTAFIPDTEPRFEELTEAVTSPYFPGTDAPTEATTAPEYDSNSLEGDNGGSNSDLDIDAEKLILVYDKAKKLAKKIEESFESLIDFSCLNSLKTTNNIPIDTSALDACKSGLKALGGIGPDGSHISQIAETIKKIIELFAEYDEGVAALWDQYNTENEEDDFGSGLDAEPSNAGGRTPESQTDPYGNIITTEPTTAEPEAPTDPGYSPRIPGTDPGTAPYYYATEAPTDPGYSPRIPGTDPGTAPYYYATEAPTDPGYSPYNPGPEPETAPYYYATEAPTAPNYSPYNPGPEPSTGSTRRSNIEAPI